MSANTRSVREAQLLTLAAKIARGESLSVAEESIVAGFFGGQGHGGAGDGFPGGPAGDVRGDNDLRRTHWFNGRYLTAEALSRQDTYFDARSRLNAYALMPGIAWGLGLEVGGGGNVFEIDLEFPRRNGFPVNREIELKRGLAFDHFGRPILVSQAFRFTVEQLIGTYRKTPQQVVGGGTEFMPCICLAPDTRGPTGGGAAVPAGPYLLVIQAGESEEGGAKVMGDLCGGSAAATCRADAWRGGFGLSLVRFPVELPLRDDLRTPWDLRGTLSAYFFDVFEHPLFRRWDPDFATDAGFCRDTGPGRHDAGAIALAMLCLGEDGSVLFLDSWIPRRTICDTPAEDWHRTRFGAPPRAAAWARIHQFQCMLAESLQLQALIGDGDDLYRRGFRHIPPIGFLPLRLRGREDRAAIHVEALDAVLASANALDFLATPLVIRALDQARRYFDDTNVIVYGVVALHDDDILEDLGNVFDKDPIQLALPHWNQDLPLENEYYGKYTRKTDYGIFASPFLVTLELLFRRLGLDHLVNRRTEIVKLVVPLQGLTRRHPLVGAIAADALPQAAAWGINPALTAAGPIANLNPELFPEAENLAGLLRRYGLDMLPRHFVVYVKQRLVLLDLLFYVLEIIQLLIEFVALGRAFSALRVNRASAAGGAESSAMVLNLSPRTEDYQAAYLSQPQEKRAIVAAVLARPEVQNAVVQAARQSRSELAVTGRNSRFLESVDVAERPLVFEIEDPARRRKAALASVADTYAAEFPDYQFVQIFTAVQPADQTLALVGKLAVPAAAEPAGTVADEVLAAGPTVFADERSRALYAEARAKMAERKVADFVPGASTDLTAREVLVRPPAEAEQLLGRETYGKFLEAFAADRTAATEGAKALAGGIPAAVAVQIQVEVSAGSTAEAAIAKVKANAATAAETRALLDNAAVLAKVSGGDLRFLNLARK
jgi:hypothetical protein